MPCESRENWNFSALSIKFLGKVAFIDNKARKHLKTWAFFTSLQVFKLVIFINKIQVIPWFGWIWIKRICSLLQHEKGRLKFYYSFFTSWKSWNIINVKAILLRWKTNIYLLGPNFHKLFTFDYDRCGLSCVRDFEASKR